MRTSVIRLFGASVLLFVLTSCAARPPIGGSILPPEDIEVARMVWERFRTQERVPAIDADITLSWQVLGDNGRSHGTLLAVRPASIRVSLLDPLGRPWAILAANGRTFTLVNNHEGTAYEGLVDSESWQEYMPVPVAPTLLFGLLSGRPAVDRMKLIEIRGGEQGYWYVLEEDGGKRLQMLVDPESTALRRLLVLEGDDEVAADLQYSGMVDTSPIAWPAKIDVSGEAITGSYTIEVDKIYSITAQPAEQFTLKVPQHFRHETLE